MAKPDIQLLVGALGGSAPSGSSAVEIRQALQTALSGKNGVKVNVRLTSNAASNLRQEIQRALNANGGITVKIKGQLTGAASNPTSGSSGRENSSNGTAPGSVAEAEKYLTAWKDAYNKVERLKTARTKSEPESKLYNELTAQIENARQRHKEARAELELFKQVYPGVVEQAKNYNKVMQQTADNAERTKAAIAGAADKRNNSKQTFLSNANQSLSSTADKYSGVLLPPTNTSTALQAEFNAKQAEAARLIQEVENGTARLTAKRKADILAALTGYEQVGQKMKSAAADAATLAKNESKIIPMMANFRKYLQTISPKGLKEVASQLAAIDRLAIDKDLEGVRTAIDGVKSYFKDMGYEGGNFFTYVEQKLHSFGTYLVSSKLMNAFISGFHNAVDAVKELDAGMTQLKIVTNASDAQMEKFLGNSIKLAKELGRSVTDVLSSIETFSRLGYSLEDASTLSKYASIMANTAGVDIEAANTGITSIIKGYGLKVSDSEHVADVLIKVGQEYAISAAELMEAFEKSGAALNATNTSFEKSAGLLAAANAAVQNASTTGTALKTVSARIRGAKSDLEELGEDTTDLVDGFSKYASELKSLTGFDIMVDANHYKDIYDIFEGISKVWGELTDTQQARVAEILGGTRQLQVVSSIMTNMADATNAYEGALNSAGTASQANATYMESVGAKADRMKASFQAMAGAIMDSDLIGMVYDLGAGFAYFLSLGDGFLVKSAAIITALMSLGTAGKMLKESSIGHGFSTMFKDLARPKMTGRNWNWANYFEEAA